MNRPGPWCAVLLLSTALALSACGGDDDDEQAGGTTGTQQEQPAPTGEPSATVSITETEFNIEPADVQVDQPGVVEFRVENAGGVPHALEVESDDLEEETEDIAPGESATLTVDLPAGNYELYCPIGDHEQQGMTGELTVGDGGGGTGTTETETTETDEDETESEDDSSGPGAGY